MSGVKRFSISIPSGFVISTLRHKFYYMVVLIMCIPRFPKLKIHFNSDFLHYKELYNKVELNRAHPFKCFGSYKCVEE